MRNVYFFFSICLSCVEVCGGWEHSVIKSRIVRESEIISMTLEDYPNPQTDPESCGRYEPSFLCDPAKLLSEHDAGWLDKEIMGTCMETDCPCKSPLNDYCGAKVGCDGYSISIAMVTQLHGDRVNTQAEAERWAVQLRKSKWKFGSCGDDIVIVVSQIDRKIFTSTGLRAKQILTDDCVQDIYLTYRDVLSAGNYTVGLINMIKDYTLTLLEGECVVKRHSSGTSLSIWAIIGIVVGCSGLLVACICYTNYAPNTTVDKPYTSTSSRYKRYKRHSNHTYGGYVSSSSSYGGCGGHGGGHGGGGGGGCGGGGGGGF